MCPKCIGMVKIKKNFECIGCNLSSSLGKTCIECRDTNSIDQLLVVLDYNQSLVVKIIKTFKYRLVKDMADIIAPIIKKYLVWLSLNKRLNILSDNPVITPIPLHSRRLNWRGFNQSELIARSLADILNTGINPNILIRTRAVDPQAEIIKREERLKNIGNAFELREGSCAGKTFILVDDVCTTGATLNECARLLKNSGALKVIGLVIARG